MSKFSFLGQSSFLSAFISDWQLLTADNSWQKLMKTKINLESWNLAKISPIECTWKFQSNFTHISCHQLSTAVNSWWQLIKVDEIRNLLREPKFSMYIILSVYIKISVIFFSFLLSSPVNSWWKLLTVDEYENQSRKLKFGTYITLSMYMKIPVNFFSVIHFCKNK